MLSAQRSNELLPFIVIHSTPKSPNKDLSLFSACVLLSMPLLDCTNSRSDISKTITVSLLLTVFKKSFTHAINVPKLADSRVSICISILAKDKLYILGSESSQECHAWRAILLVSKVSQAETIFDIAPMRAKLPMKPGMFNCKQVQKELLWLQDCPSCP